VIYEKKKNRRDMILYLEEKFGEKATICEYNNAETYKSSS